MRKSFASMRKVRCSLRRNFVHEWTNGDVDLDKKNANYLQIKSQIEVTSLGTRPGRCFLMGKLKFGFSSSTCW